jgi:hypothetical protein
MTITLRVGYVKPNLYMHAYRLELYVKVISDFANKTCNLNLLMFHESHRGLFNFLKIQSHRESPNLSGDK